MAILGNIYKLEKFVKDHSLDLVFNYFKQALNENSTINKRIMSLPIGAFEKIPIENDIFALEQVFFTKSREECFVESHKKYIDFQLILFGKEQMEYIDIDKLTINDAYDLEKDLITYQMPLTTSKFMMEKGDLAIFFPEDAHVGLAKSYSEEIVYKTVIKYPVKLYESQRRIQ